MDEDTDGSKNSRDSLASWHFAALLTVLLTLAGAVVFGLAHRPPTLALNVSAPDTTPVPMISQTPALIYCHVAGAVESPGVYSLPSGSLVADAIQIAGGPSDGADLEQLNLVAAVLDHSQIVVPKRQTTRTPGAQRAPAPLTPDLININAADRALLETLPGIGPVLAQRIIDRRTEHGRFSTVDELMEVKGIGEVTLSKLRALIVAGP